MPKIIDVRCLFFVVSRNFVMFDYTVFFPAKISYSNISWLLPYLFRAVPQSYLSGYLMGYSPQKVPE